MNKTLHRKLTEHQIYHPLHTQALNRKDYGVLTGLHYEMNILRNIANDLLQPRQEAIANILKMSRDI